MTLTMQDRLKKIALSLWIVSCCLILCSCDEARTVFQDDLGKSKNGFQVIPQSIESPFVQPLYIDGELTSTAEVPVKEKHTGHSDMRYKVASIDFNHVSSPYIISLWIIIAGLAKIGFHVTPHFRLICPESCMLVLTGVLIGLLLFFTGLSSVGPLSPDVFFIFMLPPIVLDAGYFMPNRLFFDNLFTILLYAVVGTVWNALTIGLSLWAIGLTGLYNRSMPLLDTLLFSSIVSAVDPVAVLAVFEEIHVNEVLYIIVFGESLLNDAVTVVLYHMFEGYTEMGLANILPVDYVAGVASFFVVSLGGTVVGIIFGFLASFLSRFTHHVSVIEPLFVFVMAYLSYLTAEIFHLSGIMALTFCGITMKNYIEENVSHKSHVTLKYTMKMLANSSETIIFVLLGVSTVNDKHEWNTWFVLLTILFCSVYRSLGVILLTALANRFRLHQFNKVEQFIMSYGGLRGAVAFALVLIIDDNVIPSKNMMVTTIISVVYFTVFVQGMTIGFFVNFLNVAKSQKEEVSMNERFHSTVVDHLMAGIEGISDHLLGNNKMRDKFKYYNNKYLRPLLTNNSDVQEPKIFQTHSKLNLSDAVNIVKNNGNVPMINPEAGLSLSTMFKTYTQSNLCKLAPDEIPTANNSSSSAFLNVDMGELTYNPSFKDLADAEIHHILEDSMFKPQRRSRRYSRSELYEALPKHPPFHHHMRMQIRRLMSESRRHRKKYRLHPLNSSPVTNDKKPTVSTIYVDTGKNHPKVTVTSASNDLKIPPSMIINDTSDGEDEGIVFTAGAKEPSDVSDFGWRNTRAVAATEVLPWKRNEEAEKSDPAVPQKEFPTWVENREYYPGYLSPTNTFLEGLLSGKHSVETIHESVDEDDSDEGGEGATGGFHRIQQRPRSDTVMMDDRRRFYRESTDPRSQPENVDSTHKSQNSPDRHSKYSSDSDSRRDSLEAVSIECPDVALDLENDSDSKL